MQKKAAKRKNISIYTNEDKNQQSDSREYQQPFIQE